jgi:hypothetical protein
MSFELNNEKAMDVMIWWIESADGSIDYRENEAVKRVLADMNYNLDTFYEETLMHISGLSNENMQKLIENSIQWGSTHYDEHQKKHALALLGTIAASDGEVTNDQQDKLARIKKAFGV